MASFGSLWRRYRLVSQLRSCQARADQIVEEGNYDVDLVFEQVSQKHRRLNPLLVMRAARVAALNTLGLDKEGLDLTSMIRSGEIVSGESEEWDSVWEKEMTSAVAVFEVIARQLDQGKGWIEGEMRKALKEAKGNLTKSDLARLHELHCRMYLLDKRIERMQKGIEE